MDVRVLLQMNGLCQKDFSNLQTLIVAISRLGLADLIQHVRRFQGI